MYSSLSYDPKYALNAICPYFTMFPLEFPLKVLRKFKSQSPIVFDPFCGRGTTIYAARTLGLDAWGFDTSPIAIAIAKAKLSSARLKDIIALARHYLEIEPSHVPQNEFFRRAYTPTVLRNLCSLREGLLRVRNERSETALLRAACLGCLHGPLSKTKEGAGYFSNQMPRTFSTKPDYSIKYWKENTLYAPRINVIKVLTRKLSRIEDLDSEIEGSHEQVINLNSCKARSYKSIPKDVGVVVTSPPYYGMTTYIQDQWLRMWFLGGPDYVDYETKDQIHHGSVDTFIKDLASVWSNLYSSEADDLDMFIRFGTLPSTEQDAKTVLHSSLEEAGGFRVAYTQNASGADQGRRQANGQMNVESQPDDEYDFHVVRA
jgi:hypothetical protein